MDKNTGFHPFGQFVEAAFPESDRDIVPLTFKDGSTTYHYRGEEYLTEEEAITARDGPSWGKKAVEFAGKTLMSSPTINYVVNKAAPVVGKVLGNQTVQDALSLPGEEAIAGAVGDSFVKYGYPRILGETGTYLAYPGPENPTKFDDVGRIFDATSDGMKLVDTDGTILRNSDGAINENAFAIKGKGSASDDINRLQYKADIEHNDFVKLQLKEWGMEDGVFSIDKFFSQVRKDPLTGVQKKSSTEGRRFIELFLTPKALMEDFNKLRSDPKGLHQVFKSRFVDMLEKRGLDPSLVNYHHIAGLYDSLPLYEGLIYGSDEWWDLTALLLEKDIRPGASGFKEKTNFMSILGMAQQQGQKGNDAMPHGVAHLFYKHKLGAQRTFNKENDLFFSKSEIEKIKTKGNYRDPITGEVHNSYREFKAKQWSDIVSGSEDIAVEAMKQWEAVNPKGNMDFTELVDYLNTLDNAGKLPRIEGQYQVPLIPKLIEEITEASKGLEKMDPKSEAYKLALVSKLLDMNLPPKFITSYYKKISGATIKLDRVKDIAKNMKISQPRNTKKKYPKK